MNFASLKRISPTARPPIVLLTFITDIFLRVWTWLKCSFISSNQLATSSKPARDHKAVANLQTDQTIDGVRTIYHIFSSAHPCPKTHPFAFAGGSHCCKYAMERDDRDRGDCSTGYLGPDSNCCYADKQVACLRPLVSTTFVSNTFKL